MKTVGDIEFSESCCGEHSFVAEYIRPDGIGFLLKRSPISGLYSASVYESDHITVRCTKTEATADEVNSLLLS